LTIAGCGGGGSDAEKVKTVPFSGNITIDGKPAGEMTVQFLPTSADGGARSAYAEIQPDGSFTATTYITGDGIVPGNYTVKAGKEADGSSTDPAEMMAAVAGAAIDEIDVQVPADGLTDVELKLTSSGGKKSAAGRSMLGE